jgi:hypothetical protein
MELIAGPTWTSTIRRRTPRAELEALERAHLLIAKTAATDIVPLGRTGAASWVGVEARCAAMFTVRPRDGDYGIRREIVAPLPGLRSRPPRP